MVHVSLCVLYEVLKGPYSKKREFGMNCTRKDSFQNAHFQSFELIGYIHLRCLSSNTIYSIVLHIG